MCIVILLLGQFERIVIFRSVLFADRKYLRYIYGIVPKHSCYSNRTHIRVQPDTVDFCPKTTRLLITLILT